MSRTRFTRQLQFFTRVIRRAMAEGISPEAWLERHPRLKSNNRQSLMDESLASGSRDRRANVQGLSRRELLVRLSAVPTAALAVGLAGQFGGSLAGCTPLDETPTPASDSPTVTPEQEQYSVVIVGAGMAGINACHRLAQEGVRAEVFEARDRVGGRMYSGTGVFAADLGAEANDLVTELGAEFVNSTDKELLTLASELGLSLVDLTEHYDLEDVYFFEGQKVTMRELLPDLKLLSTAADQALAGFQGTVSYQDTAGAVALDNTSVSDWLDSLGLSAIGKAYATACVKADYGGEPDEMSAISAAYFFGTDSYPYDEHWGIRGGNDQVPKLLATLYPDQLHLKHQLTALEKVEEGWKLKFDLLDNDGKATGAQLIVLAESVIMTLPFSTLRKIQLPAELPEVKRRCIDTLGYGNNAKRVLPVSERFWLEQGQNGYAVSDLSFGMGWDSCVGQDGTPGTWSNFLSAAEGLALAEGSTAEQTQALIAELKAFWPDVEQFARGDGHRQCWPSDPFALGSYACYLKGQYTTIAGAEAEAVGTLYFAGEHTSVEFQGYMNGAAQTGRDAAEAVLSALRGSPLPAKKPQACLRVGRRQPAATP